ncbi:uncharacterized protein B0H64DRAFT_445271 [Chaetomium fimeti]|uniref:Uncharacterized protein n=1 Tax=Chaetomium fimeti TaxID=1854472 RepID=A0AAE0H9B0_9PEZI|nr:hypothetical protein B0H64DRAFT_445271 [Chaetomium fimeti]
MTRQYYCWKVSLTYRCGCTQLAPIAHQCPPDREGCNSWLTHKRTDKECEAHRLGFGLTSSAAASSSSSSSSASSASSSPRPSQQQSSEDGSGGEGAGAGEGVPGRRGSPVGDESGGGEAGAAVAGRRVVGYY